MTGFRCTDGCCATGMRLEPIARTATTAARYRYRIGAHCNLGVEDSYAGPRGHHGKRRRLRNAGGSGQGRGHERIQGQDLLLLREGLQDEVRREPEPVRQVEAGL